MRVSGFLLLRRVRGEALFAACALAVGVGLVLSGCGYSLAGRGSFLPPNIKSIGIPVFTNHSTVFNLETLLTDKVRAEFIGRGKYQILPQANGVDALLIGDISTVSLVPVSFTPGQQASRYTLTMIANISFKNMEDDSVIWDNPALAFRQDYEATGGTNATDPSAFFNQQANALDRVSSDFARTIVSSILEAF